MNAKFFAVAMLGLGWSTVGCVQSASNEDLAALDMVGYEPMENPSGAGTSNHIWPFVYHSNKYKLFNAMNYRLSTLIYNPTLGNVYTTTLNSSIYNTGILNTRDGQDLFRAAVQCALADNQGVEQTQASGESSPDWFFGKGLMKNTSGWFKNPLTNAQKEDVFRCLIARVNRYGKEVSVVLSGPNVTNQPDENHASDGLVPDALWDVKISVIWNPILGKYQTNINEYVWPMNVPTPPSTTAFGTCGYVTDAVYLRVCGDSTSTCSFTVGNAATDCYKSLVQFHDGTYRYDYQCGDDNLGLGHPVVESWVDESAFSYDIYNWCVQPSVVLPTAMQPYIPNLP